MKIAIIIPAHNEERFIQLTLNSLLKQSLLPNQIIVVNDSSTDDTQQVIDEYCKKSTLIRSIEIKKQNEHQPGSKVVSAFYEGYKLASMDYDVICKFDADLIFPENYLETISKIFVDDSKCGIAGGFCYIKKNDTWQLESLTAKDHIRGALKAYRKECFEQIGGLKRSMGWDTVDEMLARFHGWKVVTDETLHVKHLKPTGKVYNKDAHKKQGEAFYKLRYGFLLTLIATTKLAFKKGSFIFFFNSMSGYFNAKAKKQEFLVNKEEGKFIRKYRWQAIKQKLGLN